MTNIQTTEAWDKIVEKCEKDENYKKQVIDIVQKADSGKLNQDDLKKVAGGQRCGGTTG